MPYDVKIRNPAEMDHRLVETAIVGLEGAQAPEGRYTLGAAAEGVGTEKSDRRWKWSACRAHGSGARVHVRCLRNHSHISPKCTKVQ